VTNIEEKISAIKQMDREIHAFVELASPKNTNPNQFAPFQAKTPENALPNWTFAIKSNIAVAGFAHTAGISGFRDRVAERDAFAVARLREAGVEIIGTVNMEEAALGATTNNPHFGKTHHPHQLGYTPGGSSGGSGAAVAAGMVRAALGTDTMGSCRIPAAYCGVVGFKPSYGRISCDGVEPLSRRLDHVGILAASIDDVAAVFAVLDVFDAAHADARQYPTVSPQLAPTPPLTKTRIAVLDQPSRDGLNADVRLAYEHALNKLNSAGWQLVERHVDQTKLAAARRAGLLICEAELAVSLAPLVKKNDGSISPHLQKMIAFGAAQSAPKLAAAHAAIDDAELVLRAQLASVDAICWPTAPQSAFSFDDAIPANQADFTCLANFTGAPAISLPLPIGKQAGKHAMPIGLQFMMAKGDDWPLLSLAKQLLSHLG
jgi:Asp-tRNA(Asn)/Glu-tRNA(Gln) amidotransferase A subunit family amidase